MTTSYLQWQHLFARWAISNSVARWAIFISASLLLGFTACGSGDSPASDSGRSGSEELDFFINWHSSTGPASEASDSLSIQALSDDCGDQGVEFVQCLIYEDEDTLMVEGPEWECADGEGTMDGIFPGSGLIMVCLGLDGDEIVHLARKDDITVRAGQVTDVGTIDSYRFTTSLTAPENESTNIAIRDVRLQWEAVDNAQTYWVEVSTNRTFSGTFYTAPVEETTFQPTSLQSGTLHFWRVTPVMFGNFGRPSDPWSFETAQVNTCEDPEFININDLETNAQEEIQFTFTLEAVDNDGVSADGGGALIYSAEYPDDMLDPPSSLDEGRFTWTPPPGSAGEYTVTFRVCNPCPDSTERCDTADVTITVSEGTPQQCDYSASFSSEDGEFGAGGGRGVITVDATIGCPWRATVAPDVNWLVFDSNPGGTGNGRVQFLVLPNEGPTERTCTISVYAADYTLTVTQAPAAPAECDFDVSDVNGPFDAGGDSGVITVDTTNNCEWNAEVTLGNSWLRITSGNQGTGNGSVEFEVDANDTSGEREGTISVAGETRTVTQLPPPPPAPTNLMVFYVSSRWMASWDETNPAPENYRLYVRTADGEYDFDNPIYTDNLSSVSHPDDINFPLSAGVTYFFVVRSYSNGVESSNSNEVRLETGAPN